MGDGLLVATVFLACVVEAVEALTIVLAVGVSRGWRPALQGVAAALAVLAHAHLPAWGFLPAAVLTLLAISVISSVRGARRS
jgi:uncharacterized membrane protein